MPTLNETQDRTQKALDAFMRLSKAFTTFHTDEKNILQIAYDQIKTALNVQNFCVILHDKRTDHFSVAIAFRNGELLREESIAQDQLFSLLGKQKLNALRRTQQPILLGARQQAKDNFPEDPIISSYLGVPMNVGGLATDKRQSDSIKTIGMMIAYSDYEHAYHEEDKRWLEMLADMVSNEFENARQHQRFEVLAAVQQRLALGKAEHDTLIENKEQLLQLVNEQIQQLKEIDTRNFAIVLREPKNKELRLELWYQNGQPLHVESKEVRQQFFQKVRRSTIEKIMTLPSGERLLLKNRKAVAEELLSTNNSETHAASWLGVPMRVKGDRVLGVFIVYHETQEYAYDELDAQILDMVSDQTAIALENLRLIDLEKKQRQNKEHARQQAEVLKEVARIVSSSLDLKAVAEKIFDQLAHVLEYTSVSLQAIENNEREIIGYRGFSHPDYPKRLLRKLSEDRLISKIVESQKPVMLAETKKSPLWDDFEETRQINSWIGAPLIVQEQVVGLLTVDHIQAGYYNQTTEELVVAFANQVAPALLNARLYHRLERRLMERVNDFNALRNIYAAVGSSELQEVLQHILETGIRLTSSDYADIWFYNSETHEIREELDYHQQRKEALYRQGSLRFNIFEKKSIVGHVVTTRTPYLCRDIREDQYFLPVEDNVKSELAMPIISRQEKNHEKIVLGVLNFESLKLDAFTDENYQLIEALAEQAAIAIHNARLTEMLQKQNKRQNSLIELGKTLTSKIDVSEYEILNAIYDSASLLMNTDTMYIALYDEQTRNVRFGLVYEDGKPVDFQNTQKWQPRAVNQSGKTEWIIREKQPILLKTLQEFKNWYHESGGDHAGINDEASWLGVPMIVADNVIGVIGVHHDTEEYVYNEADRDFLLSLANQAAIALEKARLYEGLERLVDERTKELSLVNKKQQVLIRLAQTLTADIHRDEKKIPRVIYDNASELMDTSNMFIALYDEPTDTVRFELVYEKGQCVYENGKGIDEKSTKTYQARSGGNGKSEWIIRNKTHLFQQTKADVAGWYPQKKAIDYVSLPEPPSSWLGVPMILAENVVGVIATYPEAEYYYTLKELEILQAMANLAAIALENAHLYKQQQQETVKQQGILIEIGQELSKKIDLNEEEILNLIYEQAKKLMDVENFSIAFPDLQRRHLRFAFRMKQDCREQSEIRPYGIGKTDDVIEQKRTLVFSTRSEMIERDQRHDCKRGSEFQYAASWVGVPMKIGDTILGVIATYNLTQEHVYTEEQVKRLESLANYAAIALENAKLFREKTNALEQKEKAERDKEESEKWAYFGRIAGSLAHRIGNKGGMVRLCVEDLEEYFNEKNITDDFLKKQLDTISRNNQYLLVLSQELFKPIKAAEEGFEKMNVADCLDDAFRYAVIPDEMKIIKQYDEHLPMVLGNKYLVEVFTELIDNAKEAMSSSPKKNLTIIARHAQEQGQVVICFSDTGKGVPFDDVPILFELFLHKNDKNRSNEKHSGFGLWWIKIFLERLQGNIRYEENAPHGATFIIELPVMEK